jgi:hypothetical protein
MSSSNFYLESPVKLVLPLGIEAQHDFGLLQKELAYEDKRATYQYLTWRKIQKRDDAFLKNGGQGHRHWYVAKFGREALDQEVERLSKARHKSCLFYENGRYWTYSGLQEKLWEIYGQRTLTRDSYWVETKREAMPWNVQPPEPRWYQVRPT